ncbi:MAG: ABC transporter permease [Prevotella sp.]
MKSVFLRELGFMRHNGLYVACLVVFPLLVMIFFTTLMQEGQPSEMPVGVVDLDNSSMSRKVVRSLDAFQNTNVKARYADVAAAREAVQRGEIYAFIYFPRDCAANMMAGRGPGISFYYTMSFLSAGSLLMSDLKTITTLGYAGVAKAKLQAMGVADNQIMPLLQPIKVELHRVGNPQTDYNAYLSPMLVPGVMFLFIFIFTAYSIGTELKFNRSSEWLECAHGNIIVALMGKMLPQMLLSMLMMSAYLIYIYGFMGFPHQGGWGVILLLGALSVLAAEGFGIFMFALLPSMRMSMSLCSLWAVLSFSMVGTAFPVMAMDPTLEALAWLFPLRHYFVIYQTSVFGGYPLTDCWIHVACLLAFVLMPLPLLGRLKMAMTKFSYME